MGDRSTGPPRRPPAGPEVLDAARAFKDGRPTRREFKPRDEADRFGARNKKKRNTKRRADDEVEPGTELETLAAVEDPDRIIAALSGAVLPSFYEAEDVSLAIARPDGPETERAPVYRAPKPRQPRGSRPTMSRSDRRKEKEKKPVRAKSIVLNGPMTVTDFSSSMLVSASDVIKRLILKGTKATLNSPLEVDTIKMLIEDLAIDIEILEDAEEEVESDTKASDKMLDDSDLDYLVKRPPIVTVMGHVDHGKTTLLDSIRKTKVAASEAGGITQGVRAHQVSIEINGQEKPIVFLDTPGHEAFTAMRSRGAKVTDIAVLVVAADDGVRPQTIEAIKHAQAARVPIVVAINKMDKEGANPDRVKQELTEHGLMPEDWGGSTVMVPISAIKGDGIDTLLEMISLVSEVEDLFANPSRAAKGTCIEGRVDKEMGSVASLLVQNGTLRVGSTVVCGTVYGKVRAMFGEGRKRVQEAGPSSAVEVLGLNGVPLAGEEFEEMPFEEARAIAEKRLGQVRDKRLASMGGLLAPRLSLSSMAQRIKSGDLKELNIIMKCDVQGSLEAITASLTKLPQHEVAIRLLLGGVGDVTQADMDLAIASDAVVIAFNTAILPDALANAQQANIDIRQYDVIYDLLDEVQACMEGLLEPTMVEEFLGTAEVRATFPLGAKGVVAGCYVSDGKLIRNCQLRVKRGKEVIAAVPLDSLKRMKDDVKEVVMGLECGVVTSQFQQWKQGDLIEAFRLNAIRRKLTDAVES